MTGSPVTEEAVRGFVLSRLAGQLHAAGVELDSVPDDLDLLGSSIIDSFGFLELIGDVENHFGFAVDFEEIDAVNLTAVGPFSRFVASSQAGPGLQSEPNGRPQAPPEPEPEPVVARPQPALASAAPRRTPDRCGGRWAPSPSGSIGSAPASGPSSSRSPCRGHSPRSARAASSSLLCVSWASGASRWVAVSTSARARGSRRSPVPMTASRSASATGRASRGCACCPPSARSESATTSPSHGASTCRPRARLRPGRRPDSVPGSDRHRADRDRRRCVARRERGRAPRGPDRTRRGGQRELRRHA